MPWQIPNEGNVIFSSSDSTIQKLSRKLKTGRTMPKETHAIPWSLRHDLAIARFWIWSVSWLSNSYTGYNGKGIFQTPKRIGKVEEKIKIMIFFCNSTKEIVFLFLNPDSSNTASELSGRFNSMNQHFWLQNIKIYHKNNKKFHFAKYSSLHEAIYQPTSTNF